MDHARVLADDPPAQVDDLTRRGGLRPEPLDQAGIVAVGDEADVLAVRLGGDEEPRSFRQLAHRRLRQVAQGEAEEVELLGGGAVKEIALVAARIGALVQLCARVVHHPADVMSRGETIGAELAGEVDEVGELHALVAQRTGHRRAAAGVIVGEAVDHLPPKTGLVIKHIVRDAEPVAHRACVVDVLSRTAGARTFGRLAMIVQLERDADHLGAGARGR